MATYYSKKAITFLRSLKRNNDRDWFAERKAAYDNELRGPTLALIADVNEAMLSFAPEHVRSPEKTMLRIYRDIRFSKDKRPYKSHISAWWARTGMKKTSGAGFYFHVSATEVTIAAGVFMPEREQLLAIRRSLITRHREVSQLMKSSRLQGVLEPDRGVPLIRAPKGFEAESAAALDLLRCRQWGLTATLPAAEALSPDLLHTVLSRFRLAAPLVAILNEPLGTEARKPLF